MLQPQDAEAACGAAREPGRLRRWYGKLSLSSLCIYIYIYI